MTTQPKIVHGNGLLNDFWYFSRAYLPHVYCREVILGLIFAHFRKELPYSGRIFDDVLLALIRPLTPLGRTLRYIHTLSWMLNNLMALNDMYLQAFLLAKSTPLRRGTSGKYLQSYKREVQDGRFSGSYDAWALQRLGGNRVPGGG